MIGLGSLGLPHPSHMLFEPGARQLQQLWCRLQVNLSAEDVLVAEIG